MQAEHEPESWEGLAGLSEEERQRELRHLFESVVPLGETERQARIEGFIRREYALPDDRLRAVTQSRLLAWLEMDPADAKTMVTSYDLVMRAMPGTIAMRRVAMVQTVSLGMTTEQLTRLMELIPGVIGQIPRLATAMQPPQPLTAIRTPAKIGAPSGGHGWRFWRRG